MSFDQGISDRVTLFARLGWQEEEVKEIKEGRSIFVLQDRRVLIINLSLIGCQTKHIPLKLILKRNGFQ